MRPAASQTPASGENRRAGARRYPLCPYPHKIVFRAVIGRPEVDLGRPRGDKTGTVMPAGKRAIQQGYAIKIRRSGNAVYFFGHLLEFAVEHQALGGIIR